MFRLPIRTGILVLATIGLLAVPPLGDAEAETVPNHISAAVSGTVDLTDDDCTLQDWHDPVLHEPNSELPGGVAGKKAIFNETEIQGFFHLESNLLGFLGRVVTLPAQPIVACTTPIVDPLVSYGTLLPPEGRFFSPEPGDNLLPETMEDTPRTCVSGEVEELTFLTAGVHATALIWIRFSVVPANPNDTCPTPDHGASHPPVLVIALLTVVPCESVPTTCVVEDRDVVVGVVELLPTSTL